MRILPQRHSPKFKESHHLSLNNDMPYSRFLDVFEEEIQEHFATVRILPIPYDLTTTYQSGARFGPEAIIQASQQVERYHDELDWDASLYVAFELEPPVIQNASGPEAMMERVRERMEQALEHGDFVLSLGGEHSVSAPLIAAYHDRYPDLQVVQIDAHGDLRQSFGDTIHSHACVMRRVTDRGIPLTQIGIRNFSEDEATFRKQQPDLPIKTWFARDYQTPEGWKALIEDLKTRIKGPIYFTIDVDGIDPSVIPATGTPEPGGLSWFQTLEIIKTLAENHEIVGADVMELAPVPGLRYAEFAVAKLCYQLISYIFYNKFIKK